MSSLSAAADFAGLVGRLADQAARLGAAHGRAGVVALRAPERIWRNASLLWPLFTKGTV